MTGVQTCALPICFPVTIGVGEEQDDVYIDRCIAESLYQKDKIGYENLNIVFTSIHGTTYTTIPKALAKAGFTKVDLVKEQMIPSGNFPTVESPNPGEPKALSMAVDLANITNGDIVIGCDPDGDRLGIAVRNLDGEIQLLNGNQTNMILTYYILDQWKKAGKITGKEFIGSTMEKTITQEETSNSSKSQCHSIARSGTLTLRIT